MSVFAGHDSRHMRAVTAVGVVCCHGNEGSAAPGPVRCQSHLTQVRVRVGGGQKGRVR